MFLEKVRDEMPRRWWERRRAFFPRGRSSGGWGLLRGLVAFGHGLPGPSGSSRLARWRRRLRYHSEARFSPRLRARAPLCSRGNSSLRDGSPASGAPNR
jgi:hypothetical protein